jgi:hypothetical protein
VTPTTQRRFGKPKTIRPITLSALHQANRGGRSIFPSRVYDPVEVARVLKDGHQSRKLGKIVAKGPRRGWPIFTLTLEERATCPRTCLMWAGCYGNSMQAAERIVGGEPLELQLWDELQALQQRHPGGFLVRLHILGDFYSLEYVDMWRQALIGFPALHVFGFTARLPGTPIGDALKPLIADRWDRFAVRTSGAPGRDKASRVVEGADADAIICPAQSDQVAGCAECALCWGSTRSIGFRRH